MTIRMLTGELLPEIKKCLASNQQIVASVSQNQFFIPLRLPSISALSNNDLLRLRLFSFYLNYRFQSLLLAVNTSA